MEMETVYKLKFKVDFGSLSQYFSLNDTLF